MAAIIPTRTDLESYQEQVALDGATYTLGLQWNVRDESWYLSLADEAGPIVSGLRVVADTPLLQFVAHARRPPGELLALDTSGVGLDPQLGELGARVLLCYLEAAT